ncbi:zinc-binding protein A33-like isoform X2 [Polyodon spathula]|uniref:zinc-binding protein A33-like isoform X2 n=1 Tax=Polyodon spathula TaxID=7913 RepID=UPI001B7F452D|nr:zinc-binding protein A33-like isoform X2 [Polyodon spathula]
MAAGGTSFSGLHSDLSCPICLELFKNPVSLPCDHNYCASCIRQYSNRTDSSVSCPECGQEFTEKTNFKTNRLLAKIVDSFKQLKLKKARQSRGAQDEFYSPQRCEEVNLYRDEEVCVDTSRPNPKPNKGLKESKPLSSSHQLHELKTEIRAQFDQLHQFLYTIEKEQVRKLQEEAKWALECMEQQLLLITQEKDLVEMEVTMFQNENSEKTKESHTLNSCKRSNNKEIPELICHELAHGAHRGPLQYAAWKRMWSIIDTVPACLTLDPVSAHPSLVLSTDQTSVEDSPRLPSSTLSPKSFEPCLDLLSLQGFATGRHYWEVRVPSREGWAVGIASESVQRKGNLPLTPQNGFWAMWLTNGNEFWIPDASPVRPALGNRARIIGVYLDKECGQLSFYNAENMEHIHTLVDTFPKKVYPYFSLGVAQSGFPGDSGVLKIHHMQV